MDVCNAGCELRDMSPGARIACVAWGPAQKTVLSKPPVRRMYEVSRSQIEEVEAVYFT